MYGTVKYMQIDLYVNTAESDRVDKTAYLTLIRSTNAKIVTPFDILQPSFTIENTGDSSSVNYVKANGRSYFCKPIIINGGRLRLDCSVDALDSWKSAIRASEATVIRNGSKMTDIVDEKLPIPKIDYIESHYLNSMDYPENAYQYAVTVYGGE